MERPRGIGAHELHLHATPSPQVGTAILVSFGENPLRHGTHPSRRKPKINKSWTSDLHSSYAGISSWGQAVRQGLGHIPGFATKDLGSLEGHIGGPITLLRAFRTFQIDLRQFFGVYPPLPGQLLQRFLDLLSQHVTHVFHGETPPPPLRGTPWGKDPIPRGFLLWRNEKPDTGGAPAERAVPGTKELIAATAGSAVHSTGSGWPGRFPAPTLPHPPGERFSPECGALPLPRDTFLGTAPSP